jgi:predicted transcriptional regulator
MARMKSDTPRIHSTIQLEEAMSTYLDEEAERTGKSRSDIANLAIQDQKEFWPKVAEIIDAQNAIILAFVAEVREIHVGSKKEHDQMLQMLGDIKNLIQIQTGSK